MVKKPNADRDNIERLESIAFWLWEYTRRNQHYRRYIDVIMWYRIQFHEVGELENLDNFCSYESVQRLMDESDSNPEIIKYNDFTRELTQKHGYFYGKAVFKILFLIMQFNKRFKRTAKDYEEGINTEEEIDKLLKGEKVSFLSKDQNDQYAVISLRKDWVIMVDGDTPNPNMIRFENDDVITINPSKIISHRKELSKEAASFEIYDQLSKNVSTTGRIDYETQLEIYELGGAGLDFDPRGDNMRLVMLWLWDKAHEPDDRDNPPKSFDEVYPLLKDRLHDGDLDNLTSDVLNRKSRIKGYYRTTEYCINNLTVLPLKSK